MVGGAVGARQGESGGDMARRVDRALQGERAGIRGEEDGVVADGERRRRRRITGA